MPTDELMLTISAGEAIEAMVEQASDEWLAEVHTICHKAIETADPETQATVRALHDGVVAETERRKGQAHETPIRKRGFGGWLKALFGKMQVADVEPKPPDGILLHILGDDLCLRPGSNPERCFALALEYDGLVWLVDPGLAIAKQLQSPVLAGKSLAGILKSHDDPILNRGLTQTMLAAVDTQEIASLDRTDISIYSVGVNHEYNKPANAYMVTLHGKALCIISPHGNHWLDTEGWQDCPHICSLGLPDKSMPEYLGLSDIRGRDVPVLCCGYYDRQAWDGVDVGPVILGQAGESYFITADPPAIELACRVE